MLILASQSPRRRQILAQMGLNFTVETAKIEEEDVRAKLRAQNGGQEAEAGLLVETLARNKAADVAGRHPGDLVLGADTLVILGDRFLGKPHDSEEARAMLRELSGKTHEVYTGVALLGPGLEVLFHDIAKVRFNAWDDYQEAAIEAYVASGQAQDKAGAYGIQDFGGTLVTAIEGDFYTVIGLPLSRTRKLLFQQGLTF